MLDHIDMEIIRCLQTNSRMQWKQIGEVVHMSGVAVANRIQRLEEMGVIEGFTIRVNEKLMGSAYCVFIIVMMKDYRHTSFQEFIQQRDVIKEAHRVSGDPCFILKVQVPDHHTLSQLLDEILVYGHYRINISIGQYK
ncbi:Lrp/AsnC family transcriptional regulator [Paenibacillus sp. SC116]|uniref:Lrp/AsnC family transcriptional regulator n=1 Tax=Paenibacillus arenosi TaxID=2774142 RepID=A0ABR9AVB5_9BACL|nr:MULTISPECIES: Lrp/AsnC family transcriptional regulator [Paenibacillus]MBD8498014.1 Lrp/AsnC family transcriptional regulator [Paenibacillus arenosi]MCR8844560.1 Lrp/AsnC family transcriptional regulator [Paenibacillus sp. SC116]